MLRLKASSACGYLEVLDVCVVAYDCGKLAHCFDADDTFKGEVRL